MGQDVTLEHGRSEAPSLCLWRSSGWRWLRDLPTVFGYLGPSLLVFTVFVFFPLGFTAYLSLTKWNLISPVRRFMGLGNYARLLKDPLFWKVLRNTAIFSVSVVLASMILGLAMALILNRRMFLRGFYRAAIFSPYVTSAAAMALVWLWIFDPLYGLINNALRLVGVAGPPWLASTQWALPALIIMTIWRFMGYDMLLFLGGLQNIPHEYIEAAIIDGAGPWSVFWKIKLPLLSPTTFFVIVTTFITMFQVFETVYVMTQGGPVNATNVMVFYLYQNAFQFFEAGYASAIAMVLFGIIVVMTVLQERLSGAWVHYA